MAYVFPGGFKVSNTEPVDSRLVMTKAEMLAAKASRMPNNYFCVCSDDGQMYIYNSSNEANSTTGKFRALTSVIAGDEQTTLVTTNNLETVVSSDTENVLTVASDGLLVKESDAISNDSINNLFIQN